MLSLELTFQQAVAGVAAAVAMVGGVCWGVVYYLHRHERREHEVAVDEESGFEARIPEYASEILAWLDKDHPYLDQSFKLTDVARVVPLNRTYLSRIFNEGLGHNFNDFVRDRRMAEAKRLLAENTDLPIADIADRCGFASHSSFHRSFASYEGMTPGEYRQRNSKSGSNHSATA